MNNNQELNTKKDEDEIAFKNLPGAVTNFEFDAILETIREEYYRMEKVLKSRNEFVKKTSLVIGDNNTEMPPGLMEKLTEGLVRRADGDIKDLFGKEIARSKVLVDFLNRFQTSEELLPYLSFNF